MAKNIIICSDGTGATAVKGRGTNVFKLYEAVDLNGHKLDPSKPQQIAFYDDGVGTQSWTPLKLACGAFGIGLARNVRQLYLELSRVYEPGDQLFLFGFSRGAFTVRTLAGLMGVCGVPDASRAESDKQLRGWVWDAYRLYRRNYAALLQRFLNTFVRRLPGLAKREAALWWDVQGRAHPQPTPICFLGVWDTVDAVGLPVAGAAAALNATVYRFKFPDLRLGGHVARACQALSIDDQRATFHPLVWDETGTAGMKDPRIEQVWFAGVHMNVGGGYPKQGMSLVALDWMMEEASAEGLRFLPDVRDHYRDAQNVNDKLYDSRSGPCAYYRYRPRNMRFLHRDPGVSPRVHVSALERAVQGTEGYAPGNIPRAATFVETRGTHRAARVDACSGELAAQFDEDLRKAASKLTRTRAEHDSMLEFVWPLVRLRHVSHLAAIFTTLVLAVLLIRASIAALGAWLPSSVGQWLEMGRRLAGGFSAGHPEATTALGLIAFLLVCLGFELWTRARMNHAFSVFWHTAAPGLRRIMAQRLYPDGGKAAW